MRVPGVSSLSTILELDAETLPDAAQVLLHHGDALLAEFLIIDLFLGDAGPRTPGPLGLELKGLIADGEGVIGVGVLLLPQALGGLELSAADVAPWADGVRGDCDLEPGHVD